MYDFGKWDYKLGRAFFDGRLDGRRGRGGQWRSVSVVRPGT